MEEILCSHLRKFMKNRVIQYVDKDGNNAVRKDGPELLAVDLHDEPLHLDRKAIFIGQQCRGLIEALGLIPNSQMKKS